MKSLTALKIKREGERNKGKENARRPESEVYVDDGGVGRYEEEEKDEEEDGAG